MHGVDEIKKNCKIYFSDWNEIIYKWDMPFVYLVVNFDINKYMVYKESMPWKFTKRYCKLPRTCMYKVTNILFVKCLY